MCLSLIGMGTLILDLKFVVTNLQIYVGGLVVLQSPERFSYSSLPPLGQANFLVVTLSGVESGVKAPLLLAELIEQKFMVTLMFSYCSGFLLLLCLWSLRFSLYAFQLNSIF